MVAILVVWLLFFSINGLQKCVYELADHQAQLDIEATNFYAKLVGILSSAWMSQGHKHRMNKICIIGILHDYCTRMVT